MPVTSPCALVQEHAREPWSASQVPCDPKMLIAPLQPEKLAQFSLTTLERNPRRDLVQEADLGIHISLLDIERYSVPDNAPPLAPEDAALLTVCLYNPPVCLCAPPQLRCFVSLQSFTSTLQDDVEALAVPAGGAAPASAKARERARGARAEVSWLMRTTYISSELAERRAQGAPDRRARAGPDGDSGVHADERDAHLAHCAAVEACAQTWWMAFTGGKHSYVQRPRGCERL